MASEFFLEIITPERKFFAGQVGMVVLKTPNGEMGILKDHLPMVVAVSIGPLRMLVDGAWQHAVVGEGFMEITHDKTTIMADTAEWPHEIDENRARAAAERAKERLTRQLSHIEYMRSQAALSKALARLKVKRDYK